MDNIKKIIYYISKYPNLLVTMLCAIGLFLNVIMGGSITIFIIIYLLLVTSIGLNEKKRYNE
jgi:hypothetical protein